MNPHDRTLHETTQAAAGQDIGPTHETRRAQRSGFEEPTKTPGPEGPGVDRLTKDVGWFYRYGASVASRRRKVLDPVVTV